MTPSNPVQVFPYVRKSFITPAVGDLVIVYLTTTENIYKGDYCQIDQGKYLVTEVFRKSGRVTLMNTGNGEFEGIVKNAQSFDGEMRYPLCIIEKDEHGTQKNNG